MFFLRGVITFLLKLKLSKKLRAKNLRKCDKKRHFRLYKELIEHVKLALEQAGSKLKHQETCWANSFFYSSFLEEVLGGMDRESIVAINGVIPKIDSATAV